MQAASRLYDKEIRLTLPARAIGVLMLAAASIKGWAKLQAGWRRP